MFNCNIFNCSSTLLEKITNFAASKNQHKMKWIIKGLILAILINFGCQSEGEKVEKRVIDPSQVKIDAEMGGILSPDRVLISFKKFGQGEQTLIIPNGALLSDDFKQLEKEFTLISYDMRNRGRSQTVRDQTKLQPGVWQDVEDLEAIRKHFKLDKINVIGHDYLGLMAVLYANKYHDRVAKIIQIGSFPPFSDQNYSVYRDSINHKVTDQLAKVASEKAGLADNAYCQNWWQVQRLLYVTDPGTANRLNIRICQYPNEQPDHLLPYLKQFILPSIEQLELTEKDYKGIQPPVLIVHGNKDRVSPLAGARKWKSMLPNAKLVEIKNGGHMPWIEEEAVVFNEIRKFMAD